MSAKLNCKRLLLHLHKIVVVLVLLMPAVPFLAEAQTGNGTLRVLVISEDDGTPVIGANVMLTEPDGDTLYSGGTNVDGLLEFLNVRPRTYQLQVSFVGFETLREMITLERGETRVHRVELATSTIEIGEVVVTGFRGGIARREAGKQTISVKDIELVPAPGPGGDLSVYLQTLPGVVTSGDRGGELFIRGGTPAQNLILVDKMPIIKPFHISNLFSAFPQSIISNVDMYAGGFGAEYEGATSSVLDVNLRQGNMRRFQSEVAASPYMISVLAEGPLERDSKSLLVMARHSVIEEAGPPLTGQEIPLLFYDMMARYSINWPGFTCNITGLHTYDRGRINPQRDVQLSWGNTAIGTRCLGYSEELNHAVDITIGYSAYSSSELGFDDIGRSSNLGMGYLRIDNNGELLGQPINYGLRWMLTQYSALLDQPFSEITGKEVRFPDINPSLDIFTSIFSLYLSMAWQPHENITITPGLTTQVRQDDMLFTFEPRLRVTWRPDGSDRQEFSLAGGRYVQMREAITDERDAGTVFYVYKPVGLQESLPQSLHAIAGYRRQFGSHFEANVEGYVKNHKNVPVAEWTREPGNTIRSALAEGHTYGADLRLEMNFYPLYMSMGYGWSEVIYKVSTKDLVAWLDRPVFRYNPSHDRRHQFNVLASYEFAGFTANAIWRYSSGAPHTKLSAIDLILRVPDQDPLTEQGRAVTLYSEPFDGKLPAFHRFDVSLERVFRLFPGVELEVEAGAINSYNIRNVFYFDVNTMQQVDELPLLPYLSVSMSIR